MGAQCDQDCLAWPGISCRAGRGKFFQVCFWSFRSRSRFGLRSFRARQRRGYQRRSCKYGSGNTDGSGSAAAARLHLFRTRIRTRIGKGGSPASCSFASRRTFASAGIFASNTDGSHEAACRQSTMARTSPLDSSAGENSEREAKADEERGRCRQTSGTSRFSQGLPSGGFRCDRHGIQLAKRLPRLGEKRLGGMRAPSMTKSALYSRSPSRQNALRCPPLRVSRSKINDQYQRLGLLPRLWRVV